MQSLGIDFGTSTTVACISRNGVAEVLEVGDDQEVMPSVVSYMPNGDVVVGREAHRRRLIDLPNTLYSTKRIIGSPWTSVEVAEFQRQYPWKLAKGDDDLPRFETRGGSHTAAEVAAKLFERLRENPVVQSEDIDTVTISVPAAFGQAQRRGIQEAAAIAGFEGAAVVEEPCAAGLAYRRRQGGDDRVFVYDLGGGTFDTAVLEWSGESYEVLGVGGDAYLGGDDIDLRCGTWAADEVLANHRWDIKSNDMSFRRLVLKCEEAKIALSTEEEVEVDLTEVDEVLRGKTIVLTRRQIEELCTNLVRRTFIICDETLSRAGVRASEIDSLVMSGGGCHMPMILRVVKHYFDQKPWTILAPDRIVAIGAAFNADGVDW